MKKFDKILMILSVIFSLGTMTAQEHELKVNAAKTVAEIQPTMYGIFFEDINFAADGGLYAEKVKNRSFEFELPKMGWIEPNSDRHSFNKNSGIARIIQFQDTTGNHNFARITVNDASGYKLINEGYRGMGIKKDAEYRLSVEVAQPKGIEKIHFKLIDEDGEVIGETSISPDSEQWKTYESVFTATETAEKAKLQVTFEGNGDIDLDMISLFPVDTWKGRKNGLRKDLVQLLADMDPGFLRFPGGCIVEGRTLAKRYQWKKTVGPVEDRELLVNRWNTEFSHRLTPDYYQSFGLGYYEYFQLAEDIGAEPLPILGVGIACQFNTGELVPMDELDPYVQDAIDLIQFANGPVDSKWGKIRAEMGHPEPFGLEYIGIGNEQWGPEYIERFKVFQKAIQEKYPDITIVSGSGPFPEGDYFDYGWEQLKKLNAEIIDEHYYKPPKWFRENATRYDDYDRNGPKVFAGEYAAQSVGIASPENKNNWETALSEAAFMTGLERNADVVYMTSYAPLMAHKDAWQWTPDLIWFDNLKSYGTPNYYVQKLFANNKGTDLVSVTENGKPLTGQQDLYASAVRDEKNNQLIVKLVNTSKKEMEVELKLKGVKPGSKGDLIVLKDDDLSAENSLENRKNISPEVKSLEIDGRELELELEPYSVNVVKINIK
ncbi:alpha-L-arabinofuranosidase [Christiangramia fulva]|uniref:non-reducing end alpha-L-arabinofuranosidase n=1 Tax=Christiangramia fulva TaxID=2126553 RepID=A0A2R3Z7G5_9FLAO|nr:alpha-L-arabinofuranosidase C-terminal domain-containing protein [Christiangramia fulva]AVR46226.1 alpha-L-arabinofuranosidase [Christiangramia fulva]